MLWLIALIVYVAGFFLTAAVLLTEPGSYVRNTLICAIWPIMVLFGLAYLIYAAADLALFTFDSDRRPR